MLRPGPFVIVPSHQFPWTVAKIGWVSVGRSKQPYLIYIQNFMKFFREILFYDKKVMGFLFYFLLKR